MPDDGREALEMYRREAASLLAANQRVRASATQIAAGSLVLAAAGAIVAIACQSEAVLLPLPTVVLLLNSLSFQLFAEVTVLGQARCHLETLVNDALDADALIYETRVTGIRKRRPLVASVRTLQLTWAGTVAALTVYATIAAYGIGNAWVPVLYTTFTLGAAISCSLSYAAMLRSSGTAQAALEDDSSRLPGRT
jgi:hypothetical protein